MIKTEKKVTKDMQSHVRVILEIWNMQMRRHSGSAHNIGHTYLPNPNDKSKTLSF